LSLQKTPPNEYGEGAKGKEGKMYLAKVYITLKPTVNDPQGLTIKGGLHTLGFSSVESVRAGKYLQIRLAGPDPAGAEEQVREMCRKLLANPIIEDFTFQLEEVQS
jgi:phosphoribosylformylglycinamidine synthase